MSHNFSEEEQEEEWYSKGSLIERAISAPPIMDSLDSKISSNSIFAFQSKYSHLFGDIRYEEEYENFYNSFSDPSKLPPPINLDIYTQTNEKKKVWKIIFLTSRKKMKQKFFNV